MHISVNNLSVSLLGQPVLSDISLHLAPRSTVGLTGPNGSGKSTLMRCLSGLFPAQRKQIKVAGNALSTLSQRELARHIAFVPQHAQAEPDMRVDDIIRLGRTPHRGAFAPRESAMSWLSMSPRHKWHWNRFGTNGGTSFPAARNSAARLRARWRSSLIFYCWMSQRIISIFSINWH